MVSEAKLANAVGGKTVRACDSCIRKRARWYCAADDAFLCQGCDASVHSANPLARRHERVRLKTSSTITKAPLEASLPPWHNGFIKKPRTPRQNSKYSKATKFEEVTRNPLHLVPEICSDEEFNEDQLLYRVPVFDPLIIDELCDSPISNEAVNTIDADQYESKSMFHDINQLHGSLPSDMDLEQFAADVESLLGTGLDNESFNMEALGLMDCQENNDLMKCSMSDGKVKVENDEEAQASDIEIHVTKQPFELTFDHNSRPTVSHSTEEDDVKNKGKKIMLGLDYDSVITSWADQRSPWTNGQRPQFNSFECWPYCMGNCGRVHDQYYGDVGLIGKYPPTIVDEGREARVSRYREKRRTRLFSKKIRYEVRKLNAEKRPRMKGRFVKRANLTTSSAFPLLSK